MTKNITPFQKFKDIKNSPVGKVDEMVEIINDIYRVSLDVDVPKSLINAYIKKVKDETNKDIRQTKAEAALAEQLVAYVNQNYLVIENLPVDMVASTDNKAVQGQAQEELPQIQEEPQTQAQDAQVQVSQPGEGNQIQVQAQTQPQSQGQAQIAAQEIGAQEI
jgi:hypothetical protein